MEKYAVIKNGDEIARFSTIKNREDNDFLEEFYAILLPLVPDAGNENLKGKTWVNFDEDLEFNAEDNHYEIKHLERIVD